MRWTTVKKSDVYWIGAWVCFSAVSPIAAFVVFLIFAGSAAYYDYHETKLAKHQRKEPEAREHE